MKIKKSIPSHKSSLKSWSICIWRNKRCRIIRQFGQGRLIRWYDRQLRRHRHEFIGGTDDDCRDALLWTSLFAHNVTFGPAKTRPAKSARPARKSLPNRHLQTANSQRPTSLDQFSLAIA
jgi:hypothetical protein